MVGRALVAVVLVAVVAAVVMRRRGRGSERLADLLAYAAVAVSLLVGAITYSVMGEEIDFSPALTAVTLGGPAAICLIAVGIGRLIPSAVASARWVSTGALLVFVTITGFSVGPFFAPAAILLLASSVVQTAAAPRRGT